MSRSQQIGLVQAALFAKIVPPAKTIETDAQKLFAQEQEQLDEAKKKEAIVTKKLRQLLSDPTHFANWDAVMISRVSKQTTAVHYLHLGYPSYSFFDLTFLHFLLVLSRLSFTPNR